jgi:hypothetical protein
MTDDMEVSGSRSALFDEVVDKHSDISTDHLRVSRGFLIGQTVASRPIDEDDVHIVLEKPNTSPKLTSREIPTTSRMAFFKSIHQGVFILSKKPWMRNFVRRAALQSPNVVYRLMDVRVFRVERV